jgi:Tol biopolymer transport system component
MKKISIMLIVLFCFISVAVCATIMDQGKNDSKGKDVGLGSISFSPDGKKLLFYREKSNQPNGIQSYNMVTGELIAYQSPVGEEWDDPQYSFDGKHIVFVTAPLIENINKTGLKGRDWDRTQIAVMDTDGKNVRKITNTPGDKRDPSFSHSGKEIICAINRKPNIRGSSTDVYEVNVETGQETRLTQFYFIGVSNPHYFRDDKTFIFDGFYPAYLSEIPPNHTKIEFIKAIEKIYKLRSKYGNEAIYVMKKDEKELKPYIVMPDYPEKHGTSPGDKYSKWPSLSADGSVFIFMAGGSKSDDSIEEHLYQYSSNGNHRSITRISSREIGEAVVSPDGKIIAVSTFFLPVQIVIYNVKDGTIYKEITLPELPSSIINTQ